ncbi:MAG: hypothetical protein U0103_11285 [Candidatus Obscuribacterales bacterium]
MRYEHIAPALMSFTIACTASMQNVCAQSQPADADPRHSAIYSLLQSGKAREALSQLNTVATPGPWEFYMRGQACQMIGEPVKAAEWYKTAVLQDAQNNLYRTKAVDALLAICKCDEAIQLCSDGSKLSSDAYQRQRYESKIKDIEKMKQNLAKGAENIARHKREHASQLQQAMETNK